MPATQVFLEQPPERSAGVVQSHRVEAAIDKQHVFGRVLQGQDGAVGAASAGPVHVDAPYEERQMRYHKKHRENSHDVGATPAHQLPGTTVHAFYQVSQALLYLPYHGEIEIKLKERHHHTVKREVDEDHDVGGVVVLV